MINYNKEDKMEGFTMIGYIYEQQEILINTLVNRAVFCEPMIDIFKKHDIKKIYLLGSGTSYHASLCIKNYFEKYLNVEAEVDIPTVFTNYVKVNNNKIYQNDQILVIGISQSGTSFSTINALKKARETGYLTVALTENMSSPIVQEADQVIKLMCGKELIPVETKGYTTTILQGYLWSIEIAYKLNKLSAIAYEAIMTNTQKMLDDYQDIISEIESWYHKNMPELLAYQYGHVTAYGSNICTAQEAVLKMYETYKKPLSAYELEELIHGPNMAFNEDTFIFLIASDEYEIKRVKLFTDWFKDNHVTEHVFVITACDIETSDKDLKINHYVFSDLDQLVYTLPFQIIAARNSEQAGIDTSKRPANRKSFAHDYNAR